MIKRNKNVPINRDREYLCAEISAYDKLIEYGYLPQGRTQGFKKVVVVRIENEHSNDEKKEWFYFTDWQEASEALCNKQGG